MIPEVVAEAHTSGQSPSCPGAGQVRCLLFLIFPEGDKIDTEFLDPPIKNPRQVWIGIVRPLAMHYGVLDERRVVVVRPDNVLTSRRAIY
jgi:hypothetical protein